MKREVNITVQTQEELNPALCRTSTLSARNFRVKASALLESGSDLQII